ncbi:fimbrial usher protein [Citrobacter freundii]|nr:fimbrial usher protein [Citrobacter freundii]
MLSSAISKKKTQILRHFSARYLAVIATIIFWHGELRADDELDMSFVQGGSNLDREAWALINSKYSPGRYLVDVFLNGKDIGKHVLDVMPQDAEGLCLSDEWLVKAGVFIDPDYFKTGNNTTRRCHVLTAAKATKVDFDTATQTLSLSVPQAGLSSRPEMVEWNYGNNALRVNYNLNNSQGRNNNISFVSTDLKANIGRWVFNSVASGSRGNGANSQNIAMLTASRAIQSLNADLMVGKTNVGDRILGSVETYGARLLQNNSYNPGNTGYRPVFSGIAGSSARVVLQQGRNILYSEMVPAGPFAIRDIPLYSSGEVTMTVTEENGKKFVQVIPISVIAGQLNPSQHEFSISAGIPDNGYIDGPVLSASFGYGLPTLTVRAGGVVNQNYHGITGGVVAGISNMGSISLEGGWATRKYEFQPAHSGSKMQLAWSKQLEKAGTGLQLSWTKTLTEEFPGLSGFNPNLMRAGGKKTRSTRDEWNAGISQRAGELFNLSLSGWQRKYYNESGKDSGFTGSLGTQIKEVSMSLSASRLLNIRSNSSWSTSFSISIPFTLFDQRYSSSTTMTSGRRSGTGLTTGFSGRLTDRINLGGSMGQDSSGTVSSTLNTNYSGEKLNMGGSISHSASGGISRFITMNGSMLALPIARSVMFSSTVSDTVAVVGVNNIPGVRVNSGEGKTDRNGNLVIPLNSVEKNTVTLDAGSLPLDAEISTTSQQITPSANAVIWMPFDVMKVHRYLLQVKLQSGEFVSSGTWAKDNKDTPLGFVAVNGVLMLNLIDKPERITLGECVISTGRLSETEKLQQVICD